MSETSENYLAHHNFEGQKDVLVSSLSDTDYLEHYQIKGAKHGVRRFQNYDGSLTPEGRIRYGVGEARKKKGEGAASAIKSAIKNASEKHKASSQAKKEKRAKEEALKKEKTAEERKEELKEYIRKHPKKLPAYSKALTSEECKQVIANIEFDRKMKDIRDAEIERGWRKIERFSNNLGTLSNLLKNGSNLYNNYADIYNAALKSSQNNGNKLDAKFMVKIGGGGGETFKPKKPNK